MKELNKQFKTLPPEERQYWKDREEEDKIRYAEELKQTGGIRRIIRPPRTYNSTKRNLKKNRINFDEPITESFDIDPIDAIEANEPITNSFDIVDILADIQANEPIADSFDIDNEPITESFDIVDILAEIPVETISDNFDFQLDDLDDFLLLADESILEI